MKGKLVISMIAASLLASHMPAQRGTIMRGGFGGHPPGNVVVPPLTNVLPPLGPTNPGFARQFGGPGKFRDGRSNFPLIGSPGLYGGDYAAYYEGGSSQSNPGVVVLMPQFELPPPPPPPPIRSEIREYHWPSSASSPAGSEFSIVSKDGREQPAVAVWAQDDFVCFVAPNGSAGRLPIDSIDRESTIQRNAEKSLKLPLPPGS